MAGQDGEIEQVRQPPMKNPQGICGLMKALVFLLFKRGHQ